MHRFRLAQWLTSPPLSGRTAFLCGLASVSAATAIRAAIDPSITGCEFTPYLPFVLICAVLLPWWQAGLVALLTVPTLGLLILGTPAELAASSCFRSSGGIFLAASAGTIFVVRVMRRILTGIHRSGADESAGGVLFSLDDGKVWASWYGRGPRVLLGSEDKVSGMMRDFLAQGEIARRLNRDRS